MPARVRHSVVACTNLCTPHARRVVLGTHGVLLRLPLVRQVLSAIGCCSIDRGTLESQLTQARAMPCCLPAEPLLSQRQRDCHALAMSACLLPANIAPQPDTPQVAGKCCLSSTASVCAGTLLRHVLVLPAG